MYPLIQAYQETGDIQYAEPFWRLVTDWAEKNPPNRGVNWKCGQEIAVRLFALTAAWFAFLSSDSSTHDRKKLLRQILYASGKRIEANIGYALSQSNNHGISEAAGLFTAGVLFADASWIEKGRRFLETQAADLIYGDGSFSQHSANYHRVMLHACLWTICIGRTNGIEFGHDFMEKIRLAGRWLLVLADPVSGNMPNLGSNDGALVLPVSQCGYADYRPTIQDDDSGQCTCFLLWRVPQQVFRLYRDGAAGSEQLSGVACGYDRGTPVRYCRAAGKPGGVCRCAGNNGGPSGVDKTNGTKCPDAGDESI